MNINIYVLTYKYWEGGNDTKIIKKEYLTVNISYNIQIIVENILFRRIQFYFLLFYRFLSFTLNINFISFLLSISSSLISSYIYILFYNS